MSGWDFVEAEERDGVRFSWNMWPSSRTEATKIVVPIGCLYTPLKRLNRGGHEISAVPYEPIHCKNGNCGAILNPWCQVDFQSKLWTCPFCLTRNHFPPHYADRISEQNLPAELIPAYTTLEYELPNKKAGKPIFLFVVDTCVEDKDLDELKDSLQQSLNLMPDDSLVGLITFGTNVHLHELGYTECPKSYVFRGNKETSTAALNKMLGLAPGGAAGAQQAAQQAAQQGQPPSQTSAIGRFLVPVSDCGFALESILDDLCQDPWPVRDGDRPSRATGAAMSVATALLESSVPRQGARLMMFIRGPCTLGPGAIVSKSLQDTIRCATDIQKGNAPFFQEACDYYDGLADRCVKNLHVVDVFACSLDQSGLLEMKCCIEKTGGLAVLADSFGQSVFKESFRRVFRAHPDDAPESDRGHLEMGFAAHIECLTSREFKVCGAIGPCSSLKKMSPSVSEQEFGQGGTYAWSMGGLMPSTTLAFYFEVVNPDNNPLPPGKKHQIQFCTTYQHSSGSWRMRVTTLGGPWHNDPTNMTDVGRSFDQEAAAVLMARVAVQRAEADPPNDIMRWLDRSLIRLTSKFADYEKEKPHTLQMHQEFSIYPQFMFHLRRSPFLADFNSSADESAFHRLMILGETTSNSLVMIQPALLSYTFNGHPAPVLLDNVSMKKDVILLLDTFFRVVVWHGEKIAAWREQKYQDQPEYASFKDLLEAPKRDAMMIMESRFPVPRYVYCDQHKSAARFLLAKLNPSVTHNNAQANGGVGVQQIFTDDVSLKVFMDHLVKLAVE